MGGHLSGRKSKVAIAKEKRVAALNKNTNPFAISAGIAQARANRLANRLNADQPPANVADPPNVAENAPNIVASPNAAQSPHNIAAPPNAAEALSNMAAAPLNAAQPPPNIAAAPLNAAQPPAKAEVTPNAYATSFLDKVLNDVINARGLANNGSIRRHLKLPTRLVSSFAIRKLP